MDYPRICLYAWQLCRRPAGCTLRPGGVWGLTSLERRSLRDEAERCPDADPTSAAGRAFSDPNEYMAWLDERRRPQCFT